ncbi:MAG: hypothetical protein CM1200mP41_16850 [Gammaproteobacteria bacterium]|nr:MAG: hypothetical protein CM1200mP41_16850 [Gammaproteobacteria bacterium]
MTPLGQRAESACRAGLPYLDTPDVAVSAATYEQHYSQLAA